MSFNPKYLELNKIKLGGMHKKEESNISFKDSLDKYIPAYFHFLDGLLNPDYGYTKDKLLEFLYNNNDFLIPEHISDICYLDFYHDNDKINLIILIKHHT